ncbi:MAG TPA: substrate-binding domain-containing protein, partial [Candidatus Angelobacter sp.]|nr:substrate-binding domain-containing protein [Candidatus Angelobacter sp.]
VREFGANRVEIVVPPQSILAEPPIAVVDKVVQQHGTRDAAKAYLEFLYSEEGQDIIGKNFYRPISPKAAAKYAAQFRPVKLFTLQALFGDWRQAQAKHFADGGVFDQIYSPSR